MNNYCTDNIYFFKQKNVKRDRAPQVRETAINAPPTSLDNTRKTHFHDAPRFTAVATDSTVAAYDTRIYCAVTPQLVARTSMPDVTRAPARLVMPKAASIASSPSSFDSESQHTE